MPEAMNLIREAEALFQRLDHIPLVRRVAAINGIRQRLHEHSPFADEPTDCVQWVPSDQVGANEYNPNTVAPPEMKLLALSVEADEFTQPIVVHQDRTDHYEIVDGFHRYQVSKKFRLVRQRLHGFLPVVTTCTSRQDETDRIAATSARGVHGVGPMKDIVISLIRAGWNDEDIARKLGMDQEEWTWIRRKYCASSGLRDCRNFSKTIRGRNHGINAQRRVADTVTVIVLPWVALQEQARFSAAHGVRPQVHRLVSTFEISWRLSQMPLMVVRPYLSIE